MKTCCKLKVYKKKKRNYNYKFNTMPKYNSKQKMKKIQII